MRTIQLDGTTWRDKEDFYKAFLSAIGAPVNHGHNLDALADSISGRQMNAIELPYKIVIDGFSRMSEEANEITKRFRDLVMDLKAHHHDPIDIEVPGLSPR